METREPTEQVPSEADVARNFRWFLIIWVAQMVARIGNGLTAFGLAVYVYQLTGLSTSVAAVTMAAFLPAFLLGPLGGVLADRYDRRLLMILGDTMSAIGLVFLLVAFRGGFANLTVICLGVAFSSIFGSVMDPAYRATVTDLLTPEQYSRAGGLVQLASASQFLISPALAGFLLARYGISTIIVIDIATMVVTIGAMAVVWRGVTGERRVQETGMWADFRVGVRFLTDNQGITVLMLLVTLVTFCMGFLQTLLTPMMLDLTSEQVLGVVRSAAAVGMIISSLAIGILSLGNRHLAYMAVALTANGVLVFLMGATVNVVLIGVFTFAFFMTLPILNVSVEVLARSAIPNEMQGKVWGLMGLVSQIGYIVAYAVSGLLADYVFNPLLVAGGALADSVGQLTGVGPSRGIGLMFMTVGVILPIIAFVIPRVESIKALEVNLVKQMVKVGEGA